MVKLTAEWSWRENEDDDDYVSPRKWEGIEKKDPEDKRSGHTSNQVAYLIEDMLRSMATCRPHWVMAWVLAHLEHDPFPDSPEGALVDAAQAVVDYWLKIDYPEDFKP